MPDILASGTLQKLSTRLNSPVDYYLPVGDEDIPMNSLLGQHIKIKFLGQINCSYCNRKTKKSFAQGFCYPCFKKLARCDTCIMSPEKCHYSEGTCREEAWAETHCMQDHFVYLANSSGIKVGITRGTQIPTRWMDQGAIQALPFFRVKNRLLSGLVEVVFKNHVADKTNWRKMLKGEVELLDLSAERDRLLAECAPEITALQDVYGLQAIQPLVDSESISIDYPVIEYPSKVVSLNLDKQPIVEGTLLGIKGQYLILDSGVINIRKYGSYTIEFSA